MGDRRSKLVVGVSPPGERGAAADIVIGTSRSAPIIAGRRCMIDLRIRNEMPGKRDYEFVMQFGKVEETKE